MTRERVIPLVIGLCAMALAIVMGIFHDKIPTAVMATVMPILLGLALMARSPQETPFPRPATTPPEKTDAARVPDANTPPPAP